MIITICNKEFETQEIRSIKITSSKVFIDTEEDYYELRWITYEDIKAAEDYLRFKELTRKELLDAVNIIMITCDHFLNEKEQCSLCPLQKRNGCVFTCIPLEWRN